MFYWYFLESVPGILGRGQVLRQIKKGNEMNTQELDNENIDQQLDQFWENFELFPSKAERFIFGHIYSLIGVSILPYLVMAAGLLIAHFGYGMEDDWAIRKFTDW